MYINSLISCGMLITHPPPFIGLQIRFWKGKTLQVYLESLPNEMTIQARALGQVLEDTMEHDIAFNVVYPLVQEDVQDTKPSSRWYMTLFCVRDRAWKDMRSTSFLYLSRCTPYLSSWYQDPFNHFRLLKSNEGAMLQCWQSWGPCLWTTHHQRYLI